MPASPKRGREGTAWEKVKKPLAPRIEKKRCVTKIVECSPSHASRRARALAYCGVNSVALGEGSSAITCF